MIKLLTEPEYLALSHLVREIGDNSIYWRKGSLIEYDGYSTDALFGLTKETPPLVVVRLMPEAVTDAANQHEYRPTAEGFSYYKAEYAKRRMHASAGEKTFREYLADIHFTEETADIWCEYINNQNREADRERARRMVQIMLIEGIDHFTIGGFLKIYGGRP